jgi:hypothetical protein
VNLLGTELEERLLDYGVFRSGGTAIGPASRGFGSCGPYGTETNSTKAFARLSGVLEWLKPKAAILTDRWQAEHEAKWAGSAGRDEDGTRLDQRRFSETRESLRWLAICKANEHRNHGRYKADLLGMSPATGIGKIQRVDRTPLTVAPDGHSYWAWCPSDTDICFGIAARDGEGMESKYADVGPLSVPEEDPRWVGPLDDEPPDWSGD